MILRAWAKIGLYLENRFTSHTVSKYSKVCILKRSLYKTVVAYNIMKRRSSTMFGMLWWTWDIYEKGVRIEANGNIFHWTHP